ncbi:sigma-54-dependent transcriptional regulator [Parabacteroides distasonis]|jgi:two-component system response regulator HydG|uniref:Sigma-54-dependent Fis family transcriptional regulator n=1 Tax=Parabacteroides distasonis TaxID=823 RepID=A0A3R6CAT6_PARDI|nr:sigma-54 dependent transcriptional regulator [Parabacteroides distasonis]RGM59744.1 sigma-54-dependent Fis family transcriptional regulator [Parabacteroides distasonis]RHB89023.1 sigma-54-dependent Fis family transcriptional regulator [Parabacteroides distasonis]RHD19750.1 sigma-54-dependent Fis family transcriptional regulator [Parabacteroides distasonis]RHD77818.1 sigma-54-dependent Fis family transcriptional regulator [Parabacteroides distasonis]RHM57495.1 sigma-54-dependent Fis family t
MLSILIVEDDITFSLMLTTWLGKKGFVVISSSSVSDAKRRLGEEAFDLVISDLRLPDSDGIDLLKWLKSTHPSLPLIMMTSYAEIQTAVQAMKLGAADYIAKPLNPDELLGKIKELVRVEEKAPARAPVPSAPDLYIEGQSQAARQLYEHVRLVAPTDMSVLVTGASGTGKEYIARRIHEQSNRSKAPFVAVDCGAIPKELAASEFFGHVKGSFTGAIENKTGAFVAAQGGTIFLDEIGNLTYEVQVQLLRALQERKVKPIGSNQEIAINVRLISATNENLRQAIEKGDFREDLYHRINEFTIRIPDLKERKEDLLLFANHFLDLANSELQKDIIGFDNDTMQLFQSYSWPGNLRQMKNVIKYATLLATGRYITRKELPEELTENLSSHTNIQLKNVEHERDLIRKALQECGNNKTRAAQLLGIDRKTLYNKLKIYQLD